MEDRLEDGLQTSRIGRSQSASRGSLGATSGWCGLFVVASELRVDFWAHKIRRTRFVVASELRVELRPNYVSELVRMLPTYDVPDDVRTQHHPREPTGVGASLGSW